MATRGGVEPPTFRFSGVWITVRRIPLTSVTCIAALNRTRLNADERRRTRPKMRPPGLGWLADIPSARGGMGCPTGSDTGPMAPCGWLQQGVQTRPCSSPFPRPGRPARRGGGVNGGACAIAARRHQAPLTPATRLACWTRKGGPMRRSPGCRPVPKPLAPSLSGKRLAYHPRRRRRRA